MPVESGSCNGNVNGDDWVNPDESDNDDGNDSGDDGNQSGDDGNQSGDDGNQSGDEGNDGDDGDDGNDSDDGSGNEVVDALIQDAKLAASEA